jgi:phage terminase small subunit
MAKNLTKKQELFVAEYLVDLNATRAAKAAGYSAKGADVTGSKMLVNPKVAQEIAKKQGKRLEKLDITAEKVLQELALLGFSNMLDYISVGETGAIKVDLSKLTREQAAAIQEVTVEEFTERTGEDDNGKPWFENVKRVKFKLNDKRGSLELLGKHLKLFTDKVELGGSLTVDFLDEILHERSKKPKP